MARKFQIYFTIVIVVASMRNLATVYRIEFDTIDSNASDSPPPSVAAESSSKYCCCNIDDGNNITWLGDNWILPRGCRAFSVPELQAIFGRYSILWIGDSTVRRTYATLRAILKAPSNSSSLTNEQVDSPHVIDINKDGKIVERCEKWEDMSWIDATSLCWRNEARHFDFIQTRCLKDFIPVVENLPRIQKAYDVVVVSGGSWDFAPHKRRECSGGKRRYPNFVWENLSVVLNYLRQMHSPPSFYIIWRTLGMNQHELEKDLWLEYNQVCKTSGLPYIDVAKALEPRSVLHERISGNNIYHWGLKARLLGIQMLANHLLVEVNTIRGYGLNET